MDIKEIGQRVAQERAHVGLNQRELADRAELSQPTLARIEKGERPNVALAELDRIARVLDVPLTHLTRGNPVRSRIKVAARAVPEAADDLRSATRRAEEILALDDRMDSMSGTVRLRRPVASQDAPCGLPAADLSMEAQGRQLAEAVRERLILGLGPILDLTETAESALGIDTAVIDLPERVSGFSASDPVRDVVLVLINAGDVPERQRFTLAHELGHLLFRDGMEAHRLNGDRTPQETRCDAFARHLLAPAPGVRRWMAENAVGAPGLRECAMLARHYGISLKVSLIQCQGLGLLSAAAANGLEGPTGRQLAWRFGWGPQYSAACEAASRVRPPRRILERAIEAYRTGGIGVRAVAALSDQDPCATERELAEAGIAPPPPAAVRRLDVAALITRRTGGTPPAGTVEASGGAEE
ncbi:helix-turn-helix domain-containing protein [Kitasatospora sp. NPDC091207]|uniref:helix-turn-helix domain-containing protein n=1 Tax=Kitasatospora sp. NPDC091207 TaxID=3364083 RepID=UPI0037FE29D7